MHRQIVLDTETTGLEVTAGHRVIEIGAVELVERRPTGRQFHYYLNPGRKIDEGAMEVHGITDEMLENEPRFGDIADEFRQFFSDAELIIHNAPFDVGFLDAELRLLQPAEAPLAELAGEITDTLELARSLHPGQRNSLDALCRRYEIDNSNRTLHGALLDAELLAEVYLAMTGGQTDLGLVIHAAPVVRQDGHRIDATAISQRLPVITADTDELDAHRRRLEQIDQASGGGCVWLHQGGAE